MGGNPGICHHCQMIASVIIISLNGKTIAMEMHNKLAILCLWHKPVKNISCYKQLIIPRKKQWFGSKIIVVRASACARRGVIES